MWLRGWPWGWGWAGWGEVDPIGRFDSAGRIWKEKESETAELELRMQHQLQSRNTALEQ